MQATYFDFPSTKISFFSSHWPNGLAWFFSLFFSVFNTLCSLLIKRSQTSHKLRKTKVTYSLTNQVKCKTPFFYPFVFTPLLQNTHDRELKHHSIISYLLLCCVCEYALSKFQCNLVKWLMTHCFSLAISCQIWPHHHVFISFIGEVHVPSVCFFKE